MNSTSVFSRIRALVRAAACLAVVPALLPRLLAQAAPNPGHDAQTLARYDKNKNGVLDPAELSAWQADQAKSTQAVASNSPAEEKVVELTPFEVSAGTDKGYYASN